MQKQYYTLAEACKELSISRPTLRQAIQRLGLTTHGTVIDHRARVLRREDVERIGRARRMQVVADDGEGMQAARPP